MSGHETFPDRIREHYDGLLAGDEAAYAAMVHEDFMQDWPQSGERVRGKAACLNIARNYPGGPPQVIMKRISGEGDRLGRGRHQSLPRWHRVAHRRRPRTA